MLSSEKTEANPLPPSIPRIDSLNILRGIVILGILLMNVQSYGLPNSAYINPASYGDLTGLNKISWIVSFALSEQKTLIVFSILFGAGILLFLKKNENKGLPAGKMHYKRMLVLLGLGLFHGFCLWSGDILVMYAVCGSLVYVFRKKKAAQLFGIAIVVFIIPSLIYLYYQFSLSYMPQEALAQIENIWKPSEQYLQREIAAYQGNWFQQMQFRVPQAIEMNTSVFLTYYGWMIFSSMVFGMALLKSGFILGQKTTKYYVLVTVLSLLSGVFLVLFGVYANFEHMWNMDFSMFLGWQFNYWGSLLLALGLVAFIVALCKLQALKGIKNLFSNLGRLSITNYFMQTVICSIIFYGTGFAYFGKIERSGLFLIVVSIWIFQIIFSSLWLRAFKMGPIEKVWRLLSR